MSHRQWAAAATPRQPWENIYPPPSTPCEQDESQGPTCFPSERVGGDASRVLGTRWWSSHTRFCLRWPLMFLSFGSMCSVPAASSFLGPPLARPRGPQVKNRQTYRRLTGSRQTAFFKAFKIKGIVDIFNSSCEAAACSLHQYIWSFPRIT